MRQLQIFVIIACSVFIFACSSSQETSSSDSQEQEIYVFDDVESDSTKPVETEPIVETPRQSAENIVKYIVQVGAFTTESRATEYVVEKKYETEYQMSISFSSAVNLYVVQLPPFNTRSEAEEVRDRLWATKKFEDAFILTVE